jgi:hypothetical protein
VPAFGNIANAQEAAQWVGKVEFTLDGSGSGSGSDFVNKWGTEFQFDAATRAGCTIHFCGTAGRPEIRGLYRYAQQSGYSKVYSVKQRTRCFDRAHDPPEWYEEPGDRRLDEEHTFATLGEPRRGEMGPTVIFHDKGGGTYHVLGVCEVNFTVTMDLRTEDYYACTGKTVLKTMHLSPGAEVSPEQVTYGEDGWSHISHSGPSNPSPRALVLPGIDLQGEGALKGSKLISTVEGPGGFGIGKYTETINATWDIQRATSGCECTAIVDGVKGDVLINGRPVESMVIADASRVEITTGRGRVTIQSDDKRLAVGANASMTIDHLCDPPPHSPEAWERMTPSEVWKDVWGTTVVPKTILAAFVVLVGTESDFTVTGPMGMAGVRGHLDPILRSNDDGYRLASYDGDQSGTGPSEIRGIEGVMPLQSDLDAALGGVIIEGGPEKDDITIWPLKGTVRVMDPEGRKTTLTAPEGFEVEGGALPDPVIISADWLLLRIGG